MSETIINTIEGNRLIYAFVQQFETDEFSMGEPNPNYNPPYNSDWNRLMNAWVKFRSLRLSEVDEGFNDHYSRHLESVSIGIVHYPIQQAFERLVKAIQWYNKEKHKA